MTTTTSTRAAVAVFTDSGEAMIGFADEDVRGYTPTPYTPYTYDDAKAAARLWNERAGHTPERAAEIVLSTMTPSRGEDCGSNAADWCLADNGVECGQHDEDGDRRA